MSCKSQKFDGTADRVAIFQREDPMAQGAAAIVPPGSSGLWRTGIERFRLSHTNRLAI